MLLIYACVNYNIVTEYIGLGWFVCSLVLGILIAVFSFISIFCKDVLIINKHDLILGHNLTFLRMDIEFIPKEEIESVDIGHNPITDRFYLSITSRDKSMIFGKNMPIEDLRWIRGCLIREIVK